MQNDRDTFQDEIEAQQDSKAREQEDRDTFQDDREAQLYSKAREQEERARFQDETLSKTKERPNKTSRQES